MTTREKLTHLDSLTEWPCDYILTNGCFDILHCGHVELLEGMRQRPYRLVVAINSDRSVKELKGPTRPINRAEDRARVVAGLECVDYVTIFDDTNVAGLIRKLRPVVWFKGGDYTLETLNQEEAAAAKEVGTKIVIIPFTEGYSTTKVIEAMKK